MSEVTQSQEQVSGNNIPANEIAPAESTPVAATGNPAENVENTGPEDDENHRVPKGVQKRIDRLTREKYRLLGEVEALRKGQQPAAQTASEPESVAKSPKMDDFATVEDYLDALADHKADLKVGKLAKSQEQMSVQQRQQQEQGQRISEYNKAADKARDVYDDYDEIANDPSLPISKDMAEVMVRLPNGPDIAYHLGKNPEIAERLFNLDPLSVAIEIGKLANSVARPTAKVTSSAPPPIQPIGGRSTPEANPDKMTTEEWLKWRNEQLASKR